MIDILERKKEDICMLKCMLKDTTNPKYFGMMGKVGELEEKNGQFLFHVVVDKEKKVLCATIRCKLGDLSHLHSKEIQYTTKNSSYTFEKLEGYDGCLFNMMNR